MAEKVLLQSDCLIYRLQSEEEDEITRVSVHKYYLFIAL